jgi:membrane protease YdiL (CAAX protease family)
VRRIVGWREIGVRSDNLFSSVAINAVVLIGLAVPLLLAYMLGLIRAPTAPTWTAFYPLYILVFCPAQEFSCRALMFAELNRLRDVPRPVFQILITAMVFASIHVIYRDMLTLLASLMMGLIWGLVFLIRPNLIGVSLSHAALGLMSIMVGVI